MQDKNVPAYLSLPIDHAFDHALLSEVLKPYHSVRDKVSLMIAQGEIVRIRRGLYVRARQYGGTVEPIQIANLVYGPSYVSLEYALSRYGLIPERVESITSVTMKRSRQFATKLGSFVYEHIPAKAYPAGIDFEKMNGARVLIATREKALCDQLAMAANIRTTGEVADYITENLRIDADDLSGLSMELLGEIEHAYEMHRIHVFVKWYREKYGRRSK